jgi:hypothetical protein
VFFLVLPVFNLLVYVSSVQLARQKDTILYVVAHMWQILLLPLQEIMRMLGSRVDLELWTPIYIKYSAYLKNFDLLTGDG